MSDLLEHIAVQEEAIVRLWSQEIRNLPEATTLPDDEGLLGAVRRSHLALLHVMQSGDTEAMAAMLRDSVRQRRANGIDCEITLAVWLLYRQAVQQALARLLRSADDWEQLVDRVDAVLSWVVAVVRAAYTEAAGDGPPAS